MPCEEDSCRNCQSHHPLVFWSRVCCRSIKRLGLNHCSFDHYAADLLRSLPRVQHLMSVPTPDQCVR